MSRTCHAVYLSLIVLLAAGLIYTYATFRSDIQLLGGNDLNNAYHIDNLYSKTGITPAPGLTTEQKQAIARQVTESQSAP